MRPSPVAGLVATVAFTRAGERIACQDITSPSGNVWIDWNQVLPG